MSAFNARMMASMEQTILREGGSCRDPWSFAIPSGPLNLLCPSDGGCNEPKVKVEVRAKARGHIT